MPASLAGRLKDLNEFNAEYAQYGGSLEAANP